MSDGVEAEHVGMHNRLGLCMICGSQLALVCTLERQSLFSRLALESQTAQ